VLILSLKYSVRRKKLLALNMDFFSIHYTVLLLFQSIDHLSERHLLYEHEWVPLVTLEILVGVFSQIAASVGDTNVYSQLATWIEKEENEFCWIQNAEDLSVLLKNLWQLLSFYKHEEILKMVRFLVHLLRSRRLRQVITNGSALCCTC